MTFFTLNGYDDIKEEDDIIIEVMKTIKNMKEQILANNTDIKNINNSVNSLKSISSGIDDSILKSLESKIKTIKDDNTTTEGKLTNIKGSLDNLLSLQIVCPSCNGKCSSANVTHNAYSTKGCSYCDSIGVVNIATILQKSNLLEVDFNTKANRYDNGFFNNGAYTTANSNAQKLKNQSQEKNVDNQNGNRFVISTQ